MRASVCGTKATPVANPCARSLVPVVRSNRLAFRWLIDSHYDAEWLVSCAYCVGAVCMVELLTACVAHFVLQQKKHKKERTERDAAATERKRNERRADDQCFIHAALDAVLHWIARVLASAALGPRDQRQRADVLVLYCPSIAAFTIALTNNGWW